MTMVSSILHMNGGDTITSYSNNSSVQREAISKARHITADAINQLCKASFPCSLLNVADLGCSSGPNTFFAVLQVLGAIHEHCERENHKCLEIQVFLNDLPGNDFNAIFRSLSTFHEKLKQEKGDEFGACFVSGVPGSFYEGLFPKNTMHFFHSSYCVHWLSKIPKGLTDNRKNVYAAKTSPPGVLKAYAEQFFNDFSLFLSLRSREMVVGGCMVLTLIGRSTEDPTNKHRCTHWDLLAKSLLDLVDKGLVEEEDIDSFNLPFYMPFRGEAVAIIQKNGCFSIDEVEMFEVDWVPNDNSGHGRSLEVEQRRRGEIVANSIRAVSEPLLIAKFGDSIIDPLFYRYSELVDEYLSVEKGQNTNIVISMTKKEQ